MREEESGILSIQDKLAVQAHEQDPSWSKPNSVELNICTFCPANNQENVGSGGICCALGGGLV